MEYFGTLCIKMCKTVKLADDQFVHWCVPKAQLRALASKTIFRHYAVVHEAAHDWPDNLAQFLALASMRTP